MESDLYDKMTKGHTTSVIPEFNFNEHRPYDKGLPNLFEDSVHKALDTNNIFKSTIQQDYFKSLLIRGLKYHQAIQIMDIEYYDQAELKIREFKNFNFFEKVKGM